ncbi:MAG: hypothetical protein R3C13_03695 [Hyphomonas sp.]|uniref:hypothetical protein n=1 Tax=Hyphomonas sp. TaxID=87 RepID=UPI00352827A8
MDELRTSLYVALRTAPASVKRRYGTAKFAVDGDAATHEMVDIVLKVLDRYTLEPKPLPPPVLPRCGGGA